MTYSKLASPIAELLQAVRGSDPLAFVAIFTDDAVLSDLEIEYRGGGIRAWSGRFLRSGMTIQPINALRRNEATTVTIVVSSSDGDRVSQWDWTLSLRKEKVSSLTIRRSISPALPPPAASFVLAVNTFQVQRLLETLADDAIVNDQLREYSGKAEIRNWAERDIIGNSMTMYVVGVRERYGTAIVTANVSGEFDRQGLPDPLVLSYYFAFHDKKIVQLIILPKETAE
jgi:ketosteroid isomerase-like protein